MIWDGTANRKVSAMPTYVYQKKGQKGCDICTDGFEVVQTMREVPLEKCPECGAAVERIITAPNIVKSQKTMLRDKNLQRHGFHRFVKEQKGVYRKTTT